MAVPSQVTILDGSIGHLLKLRKVQTSAADTEWATSFLVPALANVDAPNAVQQVCRSENCSHHQLHCCWLHEMQRIPQQSTGQHDRIADIIW
jgi:hypothetical protein